MHKLIPAILFSCLLAACSTAPALTPLLHKVQRINADGSRSAIPDKDLSPFQQLLRSHLPPKPPTSILALELDLPDGDGTAGAYLAVLRTGPAAELRYYEQNDHLPRVDRYFHRALTSAEVAILDAFIHFHPIAQLASAPAPSPAAPASQPATAPASTEPDASTPEDPVAVPAAAALRITDAQPQETRTVVVESPAKDGPANQLVQLLIQFRETGSLACDYFFSFPPSARMLFSDPHRKVLQVWTQGNDLRAVITPAPSDPAGGGGGAKIPKPNGLPSRTASGPPPSRPQNRPRLNPRPPNPPPARRLLPPAPWCHRM